MTVIRDERSALDIARDLRTAICGDALKKEFEDEAIFHESTNALEVKSQRTFDMGTNENKPLFSQEEIFAMVRDQHHENR